jgi:hypothetical protein
LKVPLRAGSYQLIKTDVAPRTNQISKIVNPYNNGSREAVYKLKFTSRASVETSFVLRAVLNRDSKFYGELYDKVWLFTFFLSSSDF